MEKRVFTITDEKIIIDVKNFTSKTNFILELKRILYNFYSDHAEKNDRIHNFKNTIIKKCAYDIACTSNSIYDIFGVVYRDINNMINEVLSSNHNDYYYLFPIYSKFSYLVKAIGIISERRQSVCIDDIACLGIIYDPPLYSYVIIENN